MHSSRWLLGGLALLASACAVPRPSDAPVAPAAAPVEPFEAELWRAGRPIAPGLSPARVTELEAERARARDELERRLERGEPTRLEAVLASAETPDELWGAAARVAGSLERYDLAPWLARALEPSASARRAVVAREVLHALFGRWFRRPSEVEPYLASVRGGAGTRLLLETARAEETRSRERLLTDLERRPAEAVAWLVDPDPEVRSGAARLLARGFAREGQNPGETLELLVSHLEGEHEPRAFHEALQACLPPLERAEVDTSASLRLRALLVEIARSEGEPRTLSAAQALARVPWRKEGARDLGHVLSGVEALGAMLRGLAAADRRRGVNDPDPMVAVLGALRQLCAKANEMGLAGELRASSARASLFAVLGDPLEDEAVRSSAAAAIGPLARASDGPQLAAVLSDPAVSARIKHALLGTLSALLTDLGPTAAGAQELFAAIAAQSGAADSDLRRRALALCAEARLEPLMRGIDPGFLVTRLENEDGREALLEVLGLLKRFGRPEMLGSLLRLERFDALCAELTTLDPFAAVLRQLAGSGPGALEAAYRLEAVRAEATGLARLRHALALAAALDEATAFQLTEADHLALRTWVARAVQAGVAPRDLAPNGLAFEQRLLELHLPAVESRVASDASGPAAFEGAHLTALLRADVFLGSGEGAGKVGKPQVETSFESALALASGSDRRWLVLRDRARFRAAANECVKAMSDYRRLFEAGAAADLLLGIPDLRSAVELLGRLDETAGPNRSATAGEACRLLRRLVTRPGWRAEPASVRMQDLRDWVRTAVDSGDLESLRQVESSLADLPLTQVETQTEREPPALWFGLTREAAWFQELLDLRSRVRLGMRALESPG